MPRYSLDLDSLSAELASNQLSSSTLVQLLKDISKIKTQQDQCGKLVNPIKTIPQIAITGWYGINHPQIVGLSWFIIKLPSLAETTRRTWTLRRPLESVRTLPRQSV
jgi:hypothetical protein